MRALKMDTCAIEVPHALDRVLGGELWGRELKSESEALTTYQVQQEGMDRSWHLITCGGRHVPGG